MRLIQTTSSMNKITKFFKKIKLKNAIKSVSTSGIDNVVANLIFDSLYNRGDKSYKTLEDYMKENLKYSQDGDNRYYDILRNNYDYDLLLEVLNETPVRSEKLSKLLRLCSARKIKNPVILALTIEE